MNGILTANIDLREKVKQLEQSYDSLKNSTNLMLAAIPDIQSQRLDIKTKAFEESIGNDATTEKDHRLGKSIPIWLNHIISSFILNPKIYYTDEITNISLFY